jgi:hypothetical protein
MDGRMRTANVDSCRRKRHLGVDFAVWGDEGVWFWFWFLINPSGESGVIGASSNEAQAIREACLSIEEKLRVSC